MAHPRTVIRKSVEATVLDAVRRKAQEDDAPKVLKNVKDDLLRNPQQYVRSGGPIDADEVGEDRDLMVIIISTPEEEALGDENVDDDLAFTGHDDLLALTLDIGIFVDTKDVRLLYDESDEVCNLFEVALATKQDWPESVQRLSYVGYTIEESLEGLQDVAAANMTYTLVYARGDLMPS